MTSVSILKLAMNYCQTTKCPCSSKMISIGILLSAIMVPRGSCGSIAKYLLFFSMVWSLSPCNIFQDVGQIVIHQDTRVHCRWGSLAAEFVLLWKAVR